MSILDFTSDLFHDPDNLRSFVDDPDQALRDAGLPDATPEQVHDLLPLVAESMPLDHPLQTVVHSADPVAALRNLDIPNTFVDLHHHHSAARDKTIGDVEIPVSQPAPGSRPGGDEVELIVELTTVDDWDWFTENEKGHSSIADDPLTPEIEGSYVEPTDGFRGADDEKQHGGEGALNEDVIDPENDSANGGWGN